MPRKKQERVTTAVRIPKSLHTQLHDLAEADDRSANYVIVKAIEEYCERHDRIA